MSAVTYLDHLAREVAAGRPAAVAKVVGWSPARQRRPDAASPALLGAAVLVGDGEILHADSVLHSPLPGGGATLAAQMARLAAEMLEQGETGCRWLRLPEGDVRVYVEAHVPPPVLLVVGGGHVGQQVAAAGALAGFEVWVLDDRPSFASPSRFPTARRVICGPLVAELTALAPGPRHHVVLVTRGHAHDRACLSALAGAPVAYIGMIGSRTRVRAVRDALLAEGVPEAWLDRVRAPIGLDIGARTPGEIAIAVVAEVIASRRGGTGAPLSTLDRPLVHLSRR